MPDKESETKEKVKKEEPMVDLDTSGPGAEIDLPEEKTKEEKSEIEVKTNMAVSCNHPQHLRNSSYR